MTSAVSSQSNDVRSEIAEKISQIKPPTDDTSIPDSQPEESLAPIGKLNLTSTFAKRALEYLHEHNTEFMQDSAEEIENYFELQMIQIMFNHNMQFREFVYIFEDFWNNAEPHTDRLERNINEATEILEELSQEFIDELGTVQLKSLTNVVTDYITDLKKNKEPKNGGFPDTEKMIKALLEVLVFKFDDISS